MECSVPNDNPLPKEWTIQEQILFFAPVRLQVLMSARCCVLRVEKHEKAEAFSVTVIVYQPTKATVRLHGLNPIFCSYLTWTWLFFHCEQHRLDIFAMRPLSVRSNRNSCNFCVTLDQRSSQFCAGRSHRVSAPVFCTDGTDVSQWRTSEVMGLKSIWGDNSSI